MAGLIAIGVIALASVALMLVDRYQRKHAHPHAR